LFFQESRGLGGAAALDEWRGNHFSYSFLMDIFIRSCDVGQPRVNIAETESHIEIIIVDSLVSMYKRHL
jgi:hypothetical protein